MKEIYAAKMTNTGGRNGEVVSPDGTFSLKVAPPGSKTEKATNPEQLFAAGFSACFNGALGVVLSREKIKAQSIISATVSLNEKAAFDYVIGVIIEGHIEGLDKEKTQELLEKAHQVCPYSKATRGNIEVTVKAV